MPQKYFTILAVIYFIHHFYYYRDYVAFVQISLILLWYFLFYLMYKEDENYFNSIWSVTNCLSIGFLALFIAFPLEYGIGIDILGVSLLIVLIFFSGFKFSIFLE